MVRKYKVSLSTKAMDKLSLFHSHLSETRPASSANKVIVSILDKVDSLSSFPNRYRSIEIKDYRSVSQGNYRIVYKIDEEEQKVEILTIFDNRRNPDGLLKELE